MTEDVRNVAMLHAEALEVHDEGAWPERGALGVAMYVNLADFTWALSFPATCRLTRFDASLHPARSEVPVTSSTLPSLVKTVQRCAWHSKDRQTLTDQAVDE